MTTRARCARPLKLNRLNRLRRLRGDDSGFTLIEVVVSLVIFAVVAAASVTALSSATRTSNTSRDRVAAANVAQADLEQVRALQYPNYPTAVTAHTVTVGNRTYTVSRAITTTCPSVWTPGQPTSMQVTTTVSWNALDTATHTRTVALATEIAC